MKIKTWNIEQITGYRPQTTFYEDFSIADIFGIKAIENTFKRAFSEWKNDVVYLTELAMVMNWKIWEHYKYNRELAEIYQNYWKKLDNYCMLNLKDDDLDYYFNTVD